MQRRDLTIEKIVDAALLVLKSSEPKALTMRKVADQCGVSAMAIYHHVDDKETLANLAADRVFQRACETAPHDLAWQTGLLEFICSIRDGMLETPGAGMIFISQAVLGPGTARTTELIFSYLHAGGVRGKAIAEGSNAITMLLIGSIANELTRPPNVREQLSDHLPHGEAPLMNSLMKPYANRNSRERFRIAFGWMLDGIEQRAISQQPAQ